MTSPTPPAGYYERWTEAQEYERLQFVAGRGLQSAEINDMQLASQGRLKSIADSLFKDGGIIRDAVIVVDEDTGVTQCSSGAVYIRGAVRGVAPATFTIPVSGTIAVGIRLVETVVTALTDVTLLDPATGTRNYNERGAERLKVHPQWAWDGDGGTGEFYPVYSVVDGIVTAKEPPPNLDVITQALARYDRDSAGGSYVISGLAVTMLADVGSDQVYSVASGRARVYGYPIEYAASRRIVLTTTPDLLAITDEPMLSATAGAQRVNLSNTPATNITRVAITKSKTVTLTHGITTGAQDPLPDTSVLSLTSVVQGVTTYVATTDYLLTANKVDWSPGGAEPAPGSTYTVTYQYITTVTPTSVDDTGYTVTGAVSGTLILTDYAQKLPRIDRLCLDADGQPVWIKGISSPYSPRPPNVPGDVLPIATVVQTWTASRTLTNDGVRVVPMPVLAGIDGRFDYVLQRIAALQLESSIHTREGGTKKGLFTDSFIDDSQRDAGTAQTAAIVRGELVLSIGATISQVSADITAPTTCTFTLAAVLSQLLKTTGMKINPYMAFAPVPAVVTLTPAVDRWTVVDSTWTSPITERFVIGSGDQESSVASVRNTLVGVSDTSIETLRQIDVEVVATGFGAGETLATLTFDGIVLTPALP